jgi:RNA polymerase sigma-70 factor, ECF subfamily
VVGGYVRGENHGNLFSPADGIFFRKIETERGIWRRGTTYTTVHDSAIKIEPWNGTREILTAAKSVDVDGDLRLVREILNKDRKATAEFVERYADCVYSYVRSRVMPRTELVEDLVQDVFLAAWRSLEGFRGEAGLQHWLLGIARHKVDDYYRKRLRQCEVLDDLEEDLPALAFFPSFEEQLDRRTSAERIRRVLDRLPEIYRLVLCQRYLDHRSAKEMAELAGRTEKAIERLLARARTCFRKEWNDAG